MTLVPPASGPPLGLSSKEARERLARDGPNTLPEPPGRPLYRRILAQLASALPLLLLAAVALDFGLWLSHGASGIPIEPLAILAVLVLNAVLGVLQEHRSEQALAELRVLGAPLSWVLRDGKFARTPAEQLVPGDVVRIEAGDRVPADAVLLPDSTLSLDESVLTGESLPIDKQGDDGVSSGTLATRGTALARITHTGSRSTMGRLARSLAEIQVGATPLERRLDAFGRQIALSVGLLALAMVVLGLALEGWHRLGAITTFAVAFAVAVVPEGMPAVLTLALTLGVERMAKKNAVVRRLAAVEALGSVTVIATDKTGTLTQNRLRVAATESSDPSLLAVVAALANDAEPGSQAGDALDLALYAHAQAAGVDLVNVRAENPRVSARAFDSAWKFMRVSVETPAGVVSYVKGAFEVLLERAQVSSADLPRWQRFHDREASLGRRVIALARGPSESEQGLELVGLVSVWDPPREEAANAVAAAMRAGVRVLMITGDHPDTARAVAEQVGLPSPAVVTGDELRSLSVAERTEALARVNVVARATPDDKLAIVEALQKSGEIVAMTGDGVNDAPAIKRADVGVAMGERGSDVAREVSDLVLLDDNFATIVHAIDEGRSIYENLQKFIRFTFSTNFALSVLVLGGALGSYVFRVRGDSGGIVVPLTAIQILFINFVGDGPPALALAIDQNPFTMARPPRAPNSRLLDRAGLEFILKVGLLEGIVGLCLLPTMPHLGFGLVETQTAVFLYEASAKLVSVYPARRVSGQTTSNRVLHASIAFGLALILGSIYLPGAGEVLGVEPLTLPALAGVFLLTAATLAISTLFMRKPG